LVLSRYFIDGSSISTKKPEMFLASAYFRALGFTAKQNSIKFEIFSVGIPRFIK
jgi:hypothetical protein